ncbi:hypothetical protein CXB51_037003 [Gossypium anomalum]|uniref:DUF7745 domain-containing protein n=1 Tax=Gossypium anomalum TaxID=47600 RepID=A0A8J5XUL6_9ROSI|nr:hypothetical protein CXB51_037003 [Gossypium anomalum]
MVQYWNPAYSCFTFGKVDLVPTLEEYMTLLCCPRIQGSKDYVRAANLSTFVKKLMIITGMSEQSLSACRRADEGRFIGYAQLLLVWFYSHFWKVDNVPCQVFLEGYSPLKEAATTLRRDDITEERWLEILQNLREEDVVWTAPWMAPNKSSIIVEVLIGYLFLEFGELLAMHRYSS